jgi:hypothetical protein
MNNGSRCLIFRFKHARIKLCARLEPQFRGRLKPKAPRPDVSCPHTTKHSGPLQSNLGRAISSVRPSSSKHPQALHCSFRRGVYRNRGCGKTQWSVVHRRPRALLQVIQWTLRSVAWIARSLTQRATLRARLGWTSTVDTVTSGWGSVVFRAMSPML